MFTFPLPTIRIGKCLACVRVRSSKFGEIGSPIIQRRHNLKFGKDKKTWKASRLSFCLNVKKIPRTPVKKALVLHTCDNEWCIEPNHLYIGDFVQNAKDMLERYPQFRISCAIASIGRRHSEETKRKIGKGNTGKVRSPEHRAAVGRAQSARIVSEDERRKRSISMMGKNVGKKRTKAQRLRISIARKKMFAERRTEGV